MLEKIGLDLVRRYRKQTINLQENIYLFIFFLILIFIILYYIFICVFMYLFIYYPFNTETGCITIDYFTETVGYHKEKEISLCMARRTLRCKSYSNSVFRQSPRLTV